MTPQLATPTFTPELPEPVWDIATLFPPQGYWSEDEYLALDTNHLVEFSHGEVEILPMPTRTHQLVVLYLYRALHGFASARALGLVLVAALRVRLNRDLYREPDVIFMLREHVHRAGEQFWDGADLVMEVVSPGATDRRRDLVKKRQEYAQAGIPEYWIVDPETETVTVLALAGATYAEHGVFGQGQTATSVLLPGFAVDVKELFAANE